jgi:glycosyltransferase involved in cell wall biosynthesis
MTRNNPTHAGNPARDAGHGSSVCFVTVTLVHYHASRMEAFARRCTRICVVELTDKDVFPELERRASPQQSYARYTLFPGTPLPAIGHGVLRQRLENRLEVLRPEVVCTNGWSLPGAIESLAWCLNTGTPSVLISDSTEHDHPRKAWKEMIKRRVLRLCSAGFVGGSPQAEYLAQLGMPPNHVFTGYAVVDNEHFRRGADEARRQEQLWRYRLGLPKYFFLACGRFEEVKNLPRLLRAYAAYRKAAEPQAWHLVILGDGKMRSELLALRRDLALDDTVMFPGFRAYRELPLYYGLAGAFVHASIRETWGLVVNEAMATGLPVLVSQRCGCAPDLVQNGRNGFTFDPYDVDALAESMLKIASDACDRRAMGQASRERIQRWRPETFADGLASAVQVSLSCPPPKATLTDRILLRALMWR